MIVYYGYITWSPPHLTEDEELELGRQIASAGREHFVKEFMQSTAKAMSERLGTANRWPAPVRWVVNILVGGLILFGITQMTASDWAGFGAALIPVIVLVVVVYLVSLYMAKRRFERWLDRLVAKYAAHVAKGGT